MGQPLEADDFAFRRSHAVVSMRISSRSMAEYFRFGDGIRFFWV